MTIDPAKVREAFSRGDESQLRQLYKSRWSGVWCGDLVSKDSTRMLVREGYAENTGGSPSSLDRVYISKKGAVVVSAWENWELHHD